MKVPKNQSLQTQQVLKLVFKEKKQIIINHKLQKPILKMKKTYQKVNTSKKIKRTI